MKMFEKKQCEYKGGYIVCNDEVVAIDNGIVDALNRLEEDIQRAKFEAESCGPLPCYKDPGEFERVSERGAIMPVVSAHTPVLDETVEKTMKLLDEIEDAEHAVRINEYFAGIVPVIEFVNDPFIVSGEQATQHRFDLPTIGNPLELDRDKLSDLVLGMFE